MIYTQLSFIHDCEGFGLNLFTHDCEVFGLNLFTHFLDGLHRFAEHFIAYTRL